MEMDEQNLVSRLKNGDEYAFAELYAIYRDRLYHFALRFVKSAEIAEDLFQDVFTLVWQYRETLDETKSFSSYLFTLAYHCALNKLREFDHRADLQEAVLLQVVDKSDETIERVFLSDLKHHISTALKLLTKRQREVYLLKMEGNLSGQEIAHRLKISVSSVYKYQFEASQKVRDYVRKNGQYMVCFFILLFVAYNRY